MRVAIFMIVLILSLVASFQQAHAEAAVAPNMDIAGEDAPDRQRVEPTIAADPGNPSIIVAGAQDLRLKVTGGHRWLGYYRSTDNGLTWSSSLVPGFPGDTSPKGVASPLHHFNAASDPVLAFDSSGNVYYAGLVLNITGSPGVIVFSSVRAFVAKFTNDGENFAGALILGGGPADKPWIAVDTTGGPNNGNVYVAFDSFGTFVTRSTDGGLTFSRPIPIKSGGVFPGVTVDATGNVFVSTIHFTGKSAAKILVAKSTDAGLSFTKPIVIAQITPLPSPLPGNFFRTATVPQITADSGGVYIVWDDFTTGQSNILFSRSTDGGTTWSTPVRVNDVATGQHFFPTIASAGGVLSVAWYDSRLNTCGSLICSLDVFYAHSTDRGTTFSPNIRVTTVPFNPNMVLRTDPGGALNPFLGDYISIAATPSGVHPVWTDNRNACDATDPAFGCVDQDVFTSTITP